LAPQKRQLAADGLQALAVAFLAAHIVAIATTALLLARAFAMALVLLSGTRPILVALILLIIFTLALTLVVAFLGIVNVGIAVRHVVSSAVVVSNPRLERAGGAEM
jgi:hypothetical protein